MGQPERCHRARPCPWAAQWSSCKPGSNERVRGILDCKQGAGLFRHSVGLRESVPARIAGDGAGGGFGGCNRGKPMNALSKGYTGGTHRLVAPEDTLARITPHLAACGITRCADVTGLDRLGIPVYCAIRPRTRTIQV